MEGWFYTLQSNQAKVAANHKNRAQGCAPLNNGGVCVHVDMKTPYNPTSDYHNR